VPHTESRPRLYYEVHGAGDPILLITGFGLGCSLLRPVIDEAPDGTRFIVYDHPGIGRSDRGGFAYTTGLLATSAVQVLDHLGLPAAHIAGMSLGGAIAIELALRVPERVSSLALLSTTAAGPLHRHTDPIALAHVSARVLAGSIARRRVWFGPALYSPNHIRSGGTRPSQAHAAKASVAALIGQATAAGLHDRSRSLKRITARTLVVHGEADALLPVANGRALAAGIPGARLIVLPGAGHAFELEQPARTARLLGEWAQHPPEGVPL
jgi:pimeloyl-ACP methyl ester carboxylesterase